MHSNDSARGKTGEKDRDLIKILFFFLKKLLIQFFRLILTRIHPQSIVTLVLL